MSAMKYHNHPPNPIGQRLRSEMKTRGVTSTELARRADVKTSFIYDVISGKSANPSTVKLARVAEGLGITLASLVEENKPARALKHDDYVVISPLALVSTLSSNHHESLSYLTAWIERQLGVSPNNLRSFTITGDDMEPGLCNGDQLLVDITRKTVSPPGIFVLFDGYGLSVKRIERVMHGHQARLRIVSDNPQYATYESLPEDAEIIGRVVWFSRRI